MNKVVIVLSVIVGMRMQAYSQYQSSMLHYDDNKRLVYHSDVEGNRIPDFSYAGYKNGEVGLPLISVVLVISPIEGDNTVHIQAAIDSVSALPLNDKGFRGTLLLKPGLFPLDGVIYLKQSGLVLRGSGMGEDPSTSTIILGRGTDKRTLIEIGNSKSDWNDKVPDSQVNITSEFVPAGSRTFEVDDASKFKVGDNIIIQHPSTPKWLDAVDRGATHGDVEWHPGEIDMYFNRLITQIERNKIKVDVPVYDHLDHSLSQSYVWITTRSNLVTDTGIENLRVSVQVKSLEDNDHPWTCINFSGIEDCWAKNVTVLHFGRSGIRLENATRSTVLNCTAIEPACVVKPGRIYNFCVGAFSNNILFKNCHAERARHAFVSNGTSSVSGIVFTNCSSVNEYTASESHRRLFQKVF